MTLEELMERYVDGDAEAFDELHRLIRPRLGAGLRRWLSTDDRIDDALQATLLKLHLSRSRYQRGAAVLPWIFTIARHVAIDHLRMEQKRELLLGVSVTDDVLPEPAAPEWSEVDAEAVRSAVREAVEKLPAKSRSVVHLHKLEGRSMADVAEMLGIREGAARVRAHRGYRLLARLLHGFKAAS